MSVNISFISLHFVYCAQGYFCSMVLFWQCNHIYEGFALFILNSPHNVLFEEHNLTFQLCLVHNSSTHYKVEYRAKIKMEVKCSLQTVRPKKCSVSQAKNLQIGYQRSVTVVHSTVNVQSITFKTRNSTFATMAASEQMMSLDLDLRSLTKVKVTLPTR